MSKERKERPGFRKSIQDSIEKKQEEHRKLLFRQRVDIAKRGLKSFDSGKMNEAVTAFHQYLRILEDSKRVAPGGLKPQHFDAKKDMPEMMLMAGVYWDLAKAYDREKTDEAQKKVRHYLNQYVGFSMNTPYQTLSSETLRKHISGTRKINHTIEFKNAYKRIAVSKCFVVTELVQETQPVTLERLRFYRDHVLEKTRMGRTFVRVYYWIGPMIAFALSLMPSSIRTAVGRFLDYLGKTRMIAGS